MKRTPVIIAVLIIFTFTGCVYSRVRTAGIEPSVTQLRPVEYDIIGEAEIEVSNMSLLWVVSVTPMPDYNSAIMEMISDKGGDDIIDVRMWSEKQHWIFGTVRIMHIKGKVIRYRDSVVEVQK